jgi:hypothetical protein
MPHTSFRSSFANSVTMLSSTFATNDSDGRSSATEFTNFFTLLSASSVGLSFIRSSSYYRATAFASPSAFGRSTFSAQWCISPEH